MKRGIVVAFVVVLTMPLAGCNAERRRVSEEFNKLSEAFRIKMDKGETTREQEQSYIRAISKVGYEVDRSIRGTKKADQARKEAAAIVNGLRPSDPLNLDENLPNAQPQPEPVAPSTEAPTEDPRAEVIPLDQQPD